MLEPPEQTQQSQRHVAVLGCGDLGLRLADLLPGDWRFTGLRRNAAALPAGLRGPSVDYTVPGSLSQLEPLAPDYVVTTLKPLGRDAAGYAKGFVTATENLLSGLGSHRPAAILMISSTRVYAENQGGWVNESSALETEDPAAAAIVAAEKLLLDSPHRAVVLRCAGIYGGADSRLLARIASGELYAPEPVHFSNRIHRDDVAGFLMHLIQEVECGEVPDSQYTCVDNAPVPQYEVEQWLAQQLGVAAREQRKASERHKRCSNRALTASGYRLLHPDYRSGYRALLASSPSLQGWTE